MVENIHSVMPRLAETYFYRTAAGAELIGVNVGRYNTSNSWRSHCSDHQRIDLVIKMPGGDVWAVEIKYGVAPKLGKHHSKTCDDIGATHKFVVYGGDEEFPIGQDMWMISLPKIMEKLARISHKV